MNESPYKPAKIWTTQTMNTPMKLIPHYKAFSLIGDYFIFLKMQYEHALSLPKMKLHTQMDHLILRRIFFFHEYLVFQIFGKHMTVF